MDVTAIVLAGISLAGTAILGIINLFKDSRFSCSSLESHCCLIDVEKTNIGHDVIHNDYGAHDKRQSSAESQSSEVV